MSSKSGSRRLKKSDELVPKKLTSGDVDRTLKKTSFGGVLIHHKNEGQRLALECIDKHEISFIHGCAGTGKSFLAIARGLHGLTTGKYKRLIITRPYVEAGEHLGFLPGGYNNKIAPFMYPVMEIASELIGYSSITELIDAGIVSAIPLAYMRGMAQPLDTNIATPTGFVKMGDVKVGDYVIDVDGNPTKVTGVYPQGNKDVYKITFSDHSSTECCGDHLWDTKTLRDKRYGKDYSTKNTLKILETLKNNHNAKNHEIPMTGQVQFENKQVSIDPYLLGVLLGDGCIRGTASITLTTADEEIAESLGNVLSSMNMTINKAKDNPNRPTYEYRLVHSTKSSSQNILKKELQKLNLLGLYSHNKFIPEEYKINSVETRLAILQGLMDTDGCIFYHRSGKSRTQYYTTSKQLAEDVQFLVQSLGGTSKILFVKNRIASTKKLYHGHTIQSKLDHYTLDIILPENMNPFRLSRKRDKFKPTRVKRLISSIEKIGSKECQCISVESPRKLYLTDNFIVTHNTFQDAFIVCDEAQNIRPSQMRMLLTRVGNYSKLVITGDTNQTDLISSNGLVDALDRLTSIKEIGFHEMKVEDCVRSGIVAKIEACYRGENL